MLALTACGTSSDNSASDSENNDEDLFDISEFDKTIAADEEAIDGGVLKFGLVSDTPFEGTLNWNLYAGNPDAELLQWFDESLLDMDENYEFTQDGAATFELSDDKHTITFEIRDNVNWHDGEPVTAEDWAFAYEVIGHEDYDGVRYGSDFTNIEGMEEYHKG